MIVVCIDDYWEDVTNSKHPWWPIKGDLYEVTHVWYDPEDDISYYSLHEDPYPEFGMMYSEDGFAQVDVNLNELTEVLELTNPIEL